MTSAAASGRVWYVAPGGSDSASGTRTSPLQQVQTAVTRGSSGDTIVMRGGNYNQSVNLWRSDLTLRSEPGETVWLDGSQSVSGFRQQGSMWIRDNWNYQFDHSPTYSQGAPDGTSQNWTWLNSAYPMAAWPDQVWIDGRRLQQVRSASEVRDGTFAVDYAQRRLIVGSNPAGRDVRASTLQRGIAAPGSGTVIDGVGVRRYATSVPMQGAVTLTGRGSTMNDVDVIDNATSGILVRADDLTITDVTASYNGLNGIHGASNYGIVLDSVEVRGNNVEHFNRAPSAGGIKITKSRDVTVRNSVIADNDGTGLWLDESTYDSTVNGNKLVNNAGHGLSVEISDTALVVDNLIARNGGLGVKINNTGNVSLWNNTIIDSAVPLEVVQDQRLASNRSVPGHDPRRPLPDPTVPWVITGVTIINNIVSSSAGACLICVRDTTGARTADQMVKSFDGNAYSRNSASTPRSAVVWSNYSNGFATLEAFNDKTGREGHGMITAQRIVDGNGRPTGAFASVSASVSRALPQAPAALIGVPAGTRRLGASVD